MKSLYGTPEIICFCKNCVISNQRPRSTIEFKHTTSEKKQTMGFDENGITGYHSWEEIERQRQQTESLKKS